MSNREIAGGHRPPYSRRFILFSSDHSDFSREIRISELCNRVFSEEYRSVQSWRPNPTFSDGIRKQGVSDNNDAIGFWWCQFRVSPFAARRTYSLRRL